MLVELTIRYLAFVLENVLQILKIGNISFKTFGKLYFARDITMLFVWVFYLIFCDTSVQC